MDLKTEDQVRNQSREEESDAEDEAEAWLLDEQAQRMIKTYNAGWLATILGKNRASKEDRRNQIRAQHKKPKFAKVCRRRSGRSAWGPV